MIRTRKASNNNNVWGWILDEAEEQLGEACVGDCSSSVATVRNDDSDQTIDSTSVSVRMDDETNDNDVGSTTSFTTSGYSSDAVQVLSRELQIQEASNELQRQILLQEQRLLQQNEDEERRAEDDSSEDLHNVGVTASGSYYFTALNDIDESLRGCKSTVSSNKSANKNSEANVIVAQAPKQQKRNENKNKNVTAHRDDTTQIQRQPRESSMRAIAPDDIETGMHCGLGTSMYAAATTMNIPKEEEEIVDVTEEQAESTTILYSVGDSIDNDDLDEIIGFDPIEVSENEHDNNTKTQQGRRRFGCFRYKHILLVVFVVIVVVVGITVGVLLPRTKANNDDGKTKNETNFIAPSTPMNSTSSPIALDDEPITPRFEPEPPPSAAETETNDFSDDLQLDDGALDFHDDVLNDMLNTHLQAFEAWKESGASELDDDDTGAANGDI